MQGEGGRQPPLPPCNSLSLLPSTSTGSNSDSPESCFYLLSCTTWGRRAPGIWFLFLWLPPLTGAMWVPELALTSPKASSGSHCSSFPQWKGRRSVPAAETPTPPLLPHHQSWRAAASDYYSVSSTLKSSLKGNTLIEALLLSKILMLEKTNHI